MRRIREHIIGVSVSETIAEVTTAMVSVRANSRNMRPTSPDMNSSVAVNNLEPFWMPFTANRQFKANPRLLVEAKDMHYTSADGRKILDGTAGLWCVNAGHGRDKIKQAIAEGRFKINAGAIADRLISSARELVAAQRHA